MHPYKLARAQPGGPPTQQNVRIYARDLRPSHQPQLGTRTKHMVQCLEHEFVGGCINAPSGRAGHNHKSWYFTFKHTSLLIIEAPFFRIRWATELDCLHSVRQRNSHFSTSLANGVRICQGTVAVAVTRIPPPAPGGAKMGRSFICPTRVRGTGRPFPSGAATRPTPREYWATGGSTEVDD